MRVLLQWRLCLSFHRGWKLCALQQQTYVIDHQRLFPLKHLFLMKSCVSWTWIKSPKDAISEGESLVLEILSVVFVYLSLFNCWKCEKCVYWVKTWPNSIKCVPLCRMYDSSGIQIVDSRPNLALQKNDLKKRNWPCNENLSFLFYQLHQTFYIILHNNANTGLTYSKSLWIRPVDLL